MLQIAAHVVHFFEKGSIIRTITWQDAILLHCYQYLDPQLVSLLVFSTPRTIFVSEYRHVDYIKLTVAMAATFTPIELIYLRSLRKEARIEGNLSLCQEAFTLIHEYGIPAGIYLSLKDKECLARPS